MAIIRHYVTRSPKEINMLWLNDSDFTDIDEPEYISVLSRFQFFTSYALVCTATKKPLEQQKTGCCNINLASNVFHTSHEVINPKWAFATWEANKDNVLHLHLCF